MEEFDIGEILIGIMKSLSKKKPLFLSKETFTFGLSEKLKELQIPFVDVPDSSLKFENEQELTCDLKIKTGSAQIGVKTNFITNNSRFIIGKRHFDLNKQGSDFNIFASIYDLEKMKLFHQIDYGFVIVLTNCLEFYDSFSAYNSKSYPKDSILVWEDYSYIEVSEYLEAQNFRFRFCVIEV